jgi:hypothetical protein
MNRLIAYVFITIAIAGCAVNPSRYNVTDKSGNVNCFAAGDYAVAQSMTDMYIVVNNVYNGRASEQTLTYLTKSVQASAMRYCMRGITSVKLEAVLEYAAATATAQASRSVTAQAFVIDPRRASEIMVMSYVVAYDRALTTFVAAGGNK